LCDRCCRPQPALDTLAQWRRRVQRFPALGDTLKQRLAPTVATALTGRDETLRPSTSNAGERGTRR